MKKYTALTLVFYWFLTPACISTLKYCYEGTYEIVRPDGYLMCDLCREGTYMPEYDHRHTACYNCTKTESHLDVVYSPCNRTHDTVIHCVVGYYRYLPRNALEKETCKRCTECQITGRPCQTYNDTVCCMQENSDVVLDKHGHLTCQERHYLCRKGQYLETNVNECLPCPSNTFMPLDYHVMTECWKCPLFKLPLHAEIIEPCNSTQAPGVACQKGFYMNHAMGYKDNAIGCSQCTDCRKVNLYEGRACYDLHDTVCCPEPNMTVLDILGGPLCERLQLDSPPVECCGDYPKLITNSTCRPCPTGSYMNSTNHTTDACVNCPACMDEQLSMSSTQTTPENSSLRNGCRPTETMWSCIAPPAIAFSVNVLIFFAFLLSMCVNCCCLSRRRVSDVKEKETLLKPVQV